MTIKERFKKHLARNQHSHGFAFVGDHKCERCTDERIHAKCDGLLTDAVAYISHLEQQRDQWIDVCRQAEDRTVEAIAETALARAAYEKFKGYTDWRALRAKISELEAQLLCAEQRERSARVEMYGQIEQWRQASSAERRRASALESIIKGLASEVDRLLEGRFTKDEIHGICHNLHGTVSAQEFADGCAAEQRRLYGFAPDRDAR